ncbi:MAG: glycosyltransferase family 4 protein [Caldilineaceae bacterium]|nr:glycosyltransferase family 4 protein [Caldilineaceae bacterium]MBP8109300.1 glycosyltransferase family 4 protein [Caldilineaceae bacterium]MBP8121027.1 glycosyltransferase family 4 protein [Caldilineaceae bacterium]MBP9071758.1 glycosyltransferase family 4 protein [Caldilineaceae bacterium]
MRALIISWEFPPYVVGGMGKHVAELVPAMGQIPVGDEPWQIDVLTTGYGGGAGVETLDSPAGHKITIYRVDLPPIFPTDIFNSVVGNNSALIAKGRELGRAHAYDVIHVHDWLTTEAGVILKNEWKTPLVVTIHATERGRMQGYLPSEMSGLIDRQEWRACFESWRIIVCSGHMAGELQRFFGIPLDKSIVIPNGVDPAPLQGCPAEQTQAARLRHAPNGERLLFFVGRITPEKGLYVLLDAMPQILAAYPNTRLLVAGKASEQLRPNVEQLGIADQVELLGFISDEERNCLYQSVDAAIFPSLYEPFGIVALEAMAAGCNVIASEVGGLGEVVQHLHNGLTVLPGQPESIAWAVNELFQNPRSAERWRKEAARQVEMLYNWHDIAEQTLELYQSIVEERQDVDW